VVFVAHRVACDRILAYLPRFVFPSSVLFVFQSSGDHRVLHSFPTRRSSDLSVVAALTLAFAAGASLLDAARIANLAGRVAVSKRSEEHTSELQSRENLVCRLLLEKKKASGGTLPLDFALMKQSLTA